MITLIRHRAGARALRLGFGPGWRPVDGIGQLQHLLDAHSFWAAGRSRRQLRQMLRGSAAVVSAWSGGAKPQLIGFGRASSDGVFRAVLWDVVVAQGHQGQGMGRRLVESLLAAPELQGVERTYLMTTNSAGFYQQLGFQQAAHQQLLRLDASDSAGQAADIRLGRDRNTTSGES